MKLPRRYRLAVPGSGFYREDINTDAETYGGSNVGDFGGVQTQDVPWMGRQHSILIHLPPLATLAFKRERWVSLPCFVNGSLGLHVCSRR